MSTGRIVLWIVSIRDDLSKRSLFIFTLNVGNFMKTFRRVVFVMTGLSALSLTACGEGYEMVQVRDQVPYTMERTAGPGVAFVLAHMMPEKTMVLPEPVAAPQVQDAEPLFDGKQLKK